MIGKKKSLQGNVLKNIFLSKIPIYFLLLVFLVITVAPFYWTLVSSFRNMSDIFLRPTLFPSKINLNNYIELMKKTLFWRWYFNSFFVAIAQTILGLFFCSLGGYGFAKFNFPFKNILFWILLLSMMIPIYATVIPLFLAFSKIGLTNTYWAIILPGSANGFGIFFMRQYISNISDALIDAARLDGCTAFQIYYKIILPVVKPALGALAIFLYLGSWNNFLYPLIFMRTSDMLTLPVGLASLFGQYRVEYGQVMAGAVLSVIPVIILFLKMQKQFISGLTMGSVKS